jgi:hypothetical protein
MIQLCTEAGEEGEDSVTNPIKIRPCGATGDQIECWKNGEAYRFVATFIATKSSIQDSFLDIHE